MVTFKVTLNTLQAFGRKYGFSVKKIQSKWGTGYQVGKIGKGRKDAIVERTLEDVYNLLAYLIVK